MDCPSCQAHNSDDRRFCAECGAPLAALCRDCGFENQPGARFCGGCGRALGAASPTAEPKGAAEAAGGERRQVTVLFADLAGFTALSSGLDAEDLHDLMERFFACMDGIIESYGGTVDKHIGDAVMAVFGAPVAHGDDPLRALRAAIDIHEAVASLGEDCGRTLAVHAGVASGEVLAGGLGGESRRDYTVLGDSVNLASRLDEMAKAGETLISEAVYQATSDKAKCEALGEVQVKGLGEAVRIWRLLALREQGPARHLSPFIGRRVELAQFAGVLDVCGESGSGQVIYLRGDAGIGKSRLVEELTALAEARGYGSHKGLVLDFGMGRGRDAIRALVMSFLGLPATSDSIARQATADEAVATGLVDADKRAFLNDLLDLEQPSELRTIYDAMDNETRNQGKRATVVSLLESVSRGQPVLLTVEDVHWADPITLSHLAVLASAVRECPAILVMTTRIEGDPLDGAWRTQIQGGALMTIDLAPLRREEAEGLAGSLMNSKGALVEHCIERAGGNPLFLEQLLRNAQESGGDEVPATIQSLVLSRIDRLSPADKAALQAVSVIGQRFSLEILRHLIDDAAYRPDGLIAHYLVRPEGEDLLFGHALIQESIYGSLLKTRQRSLHLRAAAWFAGRDAALNAGHLDRAQDPAAAAAYLQAARQTARDFRFARAEKLAARGLELATESAERSALTCLRGELLHDLGDAEASIEAFREGLELAEDDAERCRARIGMAAGMRIVDRLDEAFAALDAAEQEADSADLPDELARLHHLRGNLFFPLGNIAGCREAHEQALDYAQRANSTDLEARALSGLGDAEYNRGRMITANGYFRRCVELAQRHGHRRIEVANRSMVGFSRYYANEIREAYADGAAAAESASEVGHLRAELLGRLMMYWTLYDLADFDRAKEEIGNARRLAERLGSGRFLAQTHTTLASILRREGQREEALETAERAVAISLDSGAGFNGPWAMSELALNTEDDEARQRHLDEGEALLRSGAVAHNHVFFYRNAMDACLGSENWGGVERYGQTLWDFTRQEPLPICDFYIARGRSLAGHGRGERSQAHAAELRRLCGEAEEAGLMLALPELQAALAEAG